MAPARAGSPRYERVNDLSQEMVRVRAFASSLVVSMAVDGTQDDRSYGTNLGEIVGVDALCELHCMTKPIVAWTLLEVVSRHGADPHSPIAAHLPDAGHLDESVTVAGICNHMTRIAQPAALDWVTCPPEVRPTVKDLRQQIDGSWYSEVGAWIVASALIEVLSGQPAELSVESLIERCGADAYIDRPVPADRRIIVPMAGLPNREIPMLHVDHPTYRSRLGTEFGGFGSIPGYVRFLTQVRRAIRGLPSALEVDPEIVRMVMSGPGAAAPNQTWRRPVRFTGGFVDAATPGEVGTPGMLIMFAGIGNAGCLLDPLGDRQIAYYSDAASFDASDHQFLRRQLLGAFLDDSRGPFGR